MLRELTHAQHGLLQRCFQDLSQEGAQGTHTCTAWPITAVFLGFRVRRVLRELTHAQPHDLLQRCFQDLSQEGAQELTHAQHGLLQRCF